MAKHIITQLIDDLDGTTEDVRTVTFGYDGATYEIDLAAENQGALRKALEPFVGAGRRTSGSRPRRSGPKGGSAVLSSSSAPGAQPAAKDVRIWAAEQGFTVSQRGRIPRAVVEKYSAAVS